MRKTFIFIAIGLIIALSLNLPKLLSLEYFNEEETSEFIRVYEPLVDQALQAYNENDKQKFVDTFVARRVKKTEISFKPLWVDGYKEVYGKIISKKLVDQEERLNEVYPMLVYKAKFEKKDNVEIKVMFAKENNVYKLFYMRFD